MDRGAGYNTGGVPELYDNVARARARVHGNRIDELLRRLRLRFAAGRTSLIKRAGRVVDIYGIVGCAVMCR